MPLCKFLGNARFPPLFVAAASLGALAAAFTAQYGFGLRPCILCLAQRVPFALAAIIGLVALSGAVDSRIRRAMVIAAGLLFLFNGGLATYHVGVEHHWWASPGCSGEAGSAVSVTGLAARMNKPAQVACDQPPWDFHGLTMAGLNIIYSFGLATVTLALARRRV